MGASGYGITVYQLNNAGYATGCIGKWHLGPANPGFFDTFKAFNSLLRHWVGEPHHSAYRPDVETGEAIRFIEAMPGAAGPDEWREPVILQNVPQRGIEGSLYDERAVRTARHKLILRKFDVRPEFRPGELYDLDSDSDESINLYRREPNLVAQLAAQLESWAHQTRDEVAIDLARFAQLSVKSP